MNKINNSDLKKAINDIYRDESKIWNKSTADAIRYTKATWELVWWSDHIEKWENSIRRLENLIKSWQLSDSDKNTATKIILDIKNALNGN